MEAGHWWCRGGDACQSQHGQIALRASICTPSPGWSLSWCHFLFNKDGGLCFSGDVSLSTFSPAFPSFLPQSEINGSPCEVERKSATDGGKCKLLHLKKGRRWSLTASVSRAASWLYFPERCRSGAWFTLDVMRMSGSTARGMIVVLRRFDEVLLTWINDWTHPPPKTQIQSITHDFWQFYRAINATAKCESITAEHLLSVVLVNDMLMKAFK